MEQNRSRVGVIDGLRGLAILAVVFHHLFSSTTSPGWLLLHTPIGTLPIGAALSNTWLAVNLFFALSGFVIYLPYALGVRSFRERGDLFTFWRARARRLFPLFFVVTFVSIFLGSSLYDTELWKEFLTIISGLFVFSPSFWMPPQNVVLWSLGAEIWMSILFPFAALAFMRWGVLRSTACIFVGSLSVRFVATWCYPGAFVVNSFLDRLADSFAGHFDDFALGMCIAHLWAKAELDQLRLRGTALFFFGCGSMWLAMMLWDYEALGFISRQYTCFFNDIVALGSFGLIAGALTASRGWLRPFLSARPLRAIGVACYSIYVWHFLIQRGVLPFLPNRPLHVADLPLVIVDLSVVAAVSFASYRLIERCPLWTKRPSSSL